YNFSTPEFALTSQIQAKMNGDILALHQIQSMSNDYDEQLRTLKIHRKSQYGQAMLLFVSYFDHGKVERYVFLCEKDPQTERWHGSMTTGYSLEGAEIKK